MYEETDDLDDPFADDVTDDDVTPEPDPEPEPAKPAAAKPAPAAEPAAVDPATAQLAQIGLKSLKDSWVNEAKAAGYNAADFDSIGMVALDESGRAAFLEAAKASHATELESLQARGFVYAPGQTQAEAEAAALDNQDKAQEIAWGRFGPPSIAVEGDQETSDRIAERAAKGDVTGVIASMPGLGTFVVKGKR